MIIELFFVPQLHEGKLDVFVHQDVKQRSHYPEQEKLDPDVDFQKLIF